MKQGELKTIENKQYEFGAATEYSTVYLKHPNGEVKTYQFTLNETVEARKRAIKNEKDIPPLQKSYFSFTWFVIGLAVGVIACVVAVCN
jgi:hypothetical protein